MDLRKVKAGDELRTDSSTYNAMLDAAIWVRENASPDPKTGKAKLYNAGVILVQNTSGADQSRYTAMALVQPIILPSENQLEFDRRVAMTTRVPTASDKGRWCVLLNDMGNNQIGLAVVAGVVPCKINLITTGDTSVEVTSGTTTPVSGTTGLGTILWVAGGVGTASATGEQQSVIRIGGAGAGLPVGQYQYMVYQMTSQNAAGFDWPRLHNLI